MPVPSRIEGFRLVFCVLLLSASSAAMARDVRLHGADGNGGDCPEAAASEAATPHMIDKRPPAATRGKAKVPTTFRGSSDDNGSRTPRWHRFLPGMFR